MTPVLAVDSWLLRCIPVVLRDIGWDRHDSGLLARRTDRRHAPGEERSVPRGPEVDRQINLEATGIGHCEWTFEPAEQGDHIGEQNGEAFRAFPSPGDERE